MQEIKFCTDLICRNRIQAIKIMQIYKADVYLSADVYNHCITIHVNIKKSC